MLCRPERRSKRGNPTRQTTSARVRYRPEARIPAGAGIPGSTAGHRWGTPIWRTEHDELIPAPPDKVSRARRRVRSRTRASAVLATTGERHHERIPSGQQTAAGRNALTTRHSCQVIIEPGKDEDVLHVFTMRGLLYARRRTYCRGEISQHTGCPTLQKWPGHPTCQAASPEVPPMSPAVHGACQGVDGRLPAMLLACAPRSRTRALR